MGRAKARRRFGSIALACGFLSLVMLLTVLGGGSSRAASRPPAASSGTTARPLPPKGIVRNPALPPGLGPARHFLEGQLMDRLRTLAQLQSAVNGASTLTPTDASELERLLAGETQGIDTLVGAVVVASDRAELSSDLREMTADYQVDVVMAPQVHDTITADEVAARVRQLRNIEGALGLDVKRLSGHRGRAAGVLSRASELLVNMAVAVETAARQVTGVSAAVLATRSIDYPGNRSILLYAHRGVMAGDRAIAAAERDVARLRALLGLAPVD